MSKNPVHKQSTEHKPYGINKDTWKTVLRAFWSLQDIIAEHGPIDIFHATCLSDEALEELQDATDVPTELFRAINTIADSLLP